jgi:integrase
MARGGIEKLQVRHLKTKKPGRLSDGGNLYLETNKGKNGDLVRSWIFRFKMPGRPERDMGLGGLDSVGLAKARELASGYRELVATGIDPIERRDEINAARRRQDAVEPPLTFDQCAAVYIATHRAGWRNDKHRQQWTNTLATYASPVIGKLRVNEITVDHVLKVVRPLWHEKTDTMKRVRGRIETVLDFAKANDRRTGGEKAARWNGHENPARWTGNLKFLLASPEKIAPVEHHPALDYKNIGEFMAALRQREGVGALALEFTVLTCARTAETLGATWDEIDLDEKLWIVPAGRIKMGVEHRVPLSGAAITALKKVRAITEKIGGPVAKSDLVFPNDRTSEQMSENALSSILKRMKRDAVTVHGMRSSFRDWVGEETHFPDVLAELALAHKVGDKVERAYRRGTGFKKRRLLAEAWAGYCAKPVAVKEGKVLAFAKA